MKSQQIIEERRFKRFYISAQIVKNLLFLVGRPLNIKSNVPESAVLVDSFKDVQKNQFCIIIGHGSFDPIKEGFPVPEGDFYVAIDKDK